MASEGVEFVITSKCDKSLKIFWKIQLT